jgi:hypothetical protein
MVDDLPARRVTTMGGGMPMAAIRALEKACAPGAASTAASGAMSCWTIGRWVVQPRRAASSLNNRPPTAPSPMPGSARSEQRPTQALVGPAAPLPSSAPPEPLADRSADVAVPIPGSATAGRSGRDAAAIRRPAGNVPEAIDRRLPDGQVLRQASRRRVFGRRGANGSLAAAFAAVRACPRRSSSGRDSVCSARRRGWWASVAASAGASTAGRASQAMCLAGTGDHDRGVPWPGSCAGRRAQTTFGGSTYLGCRSEACGLGRVGRWHMATGRSTQAGRDGAASAAWRAGSALP